MKAWPLDALPIHELPDRSVRPSTAPLQVISATANGTVNLILAMWLFLTILFGKPFSYFQIGPLYITEIVLGLLIASNVHRITKADLAFFALLAFYLVNGWSLHGDYLFVGKDMAWMYYLLFLRFFPRNFPNQYIQIAVGISFITLLLVATSAIPYDYLLKYRIGVVLIFCVVLSIPVLGLWPTWLLALPVAFLNNYKTALLLLILLPIIYPLRTYCGRLIAQSQHLVFAMVLSTCAFLLLLIYSGAIGTMLNWGVDSLNALLGIVGFDHRFDTGTAMWRSAIWTAGMQNLVDSGHLLFGDFPGHNYMDQKYLGIPFPLAGGDELGTVRSGHNLIVHICMHTGLVGLFAFVFYYFYWQRDLIGSSMHVLFQVAVILMGFTADLIEVPSRGPLFFSYVVLLSAMQARVRRVQNNN